MFVCRNMSEKCLWNYIGSMTEQPGDRRKHTFSLRYCCEKISSHAEICEYTSGDHPVQRVVLKGFSEWMIQHGGLISIHWRFSGCFLYKNVCHCATRCALPTSPLGALSPVGSSTDILLLGGGFEYTNGPC